MRRLALFLLLPIFALPARAAEAPPKAEDALAWMNAYWPITRGPVELHDFNSPECQALPHPAGPVGGFPASAEMTKGHPWLCLRRDDPNGGTPRAWESYAVLHDYLHLVFGWGDDEVRNPVGAEWFIDLAAIQVAPPAWSRSWTWLTGPGWWR